VQVFTNARCSMGIASRPTRFSPRARNDVLLIHHCELSPRHAEPAKFLNITALPAWASPVVRLHKQRLACELNQSLSHIGFSKCGSGTLFLLYTPLRRYLCKSLLMHVVVWGLLRGLRAFLRSLIMTCGS
jgi:hypothetical protein